MLEHTLPIYAVHGEGNPIAHGSGVLLRIADASFLLSCAHVLETAQEKDAVLYVVGVEDAPLVHLADAQYHWTEDKNVDLGFALLPSRVVDLLPKGKRFLHLSDLELDRTDRPGVYSLTGYPAVKTVRNTEISDVNSTPFSFTTFLEIERLDNHIDGVTIALTYDARAAGDSEGNPARIPDPHGISGCGIWRLAAMDGPPPPNWSAQDVKLIGIEHGWLPRAFKGSYVAELIDMLRGEYPALRDSIDLHR